MAVASNQRVIAFIFLMGYNLPVATEKNNKEVVS